MQMVDVHLPTTDGRELMLTRYTEPDADQRLLLAHMKLQLPKQPPPQIVSNRPAIAAASMPIVVQTFAAHLSMNQLLIPHAHLESRKSG